MLLWLLDQRDTVSNVLDLVHLLIRVHKAPQNLNSKSSFPTSPSDITWQRTDAISHYSRKLNPIYSYVLKHTILCNLEIPMQCDTDSYVFLFLSALFLNEHLENKYKNPSSLTALASF